MDYSAEIVTYTTAIGQRRGLDLADGSHIELNVASQLSVKLSWLRRRVELQAGEALFTVAHEPFRPFMVHAGNLQIRDIGTVFNVRRRPEGTAVSVIVGEVAVNDGQSWLAESLQAGFSRQLDDNGHLGSIETANVKQATGWLEGNLVFEHTPLNVAVAELERNHAVHFVFADPAMARQTLNGSFDAADLTLFLKAVERILPIHVTREKDTIIFSRR